MAMVQEIDDATKFVVVNSLEIQNLPQEEL